MKNIKIIILAVILTASVKQANAQKSKFAIAWYKMIDDLQPTPWTAGLGWNIVDDNGKPFKKIFDAGKSWNIPPYPSVFRAEKDFTKGWAAMFNFNFNQYKAGKLVNSDIPSTSSSIFMSFDLNAKYNFSQLYDFSSKLFKLPPKLLDVYMASGFGYTSRNTSRFKGAGTYNIGFGMTAIFYKGWGMNLEAMSKFGLAGPGPLFKTPTNYLQYNFGAVYRFKIPAKSLGKRTRRNKNVHIQTKL